MSTKESQQSLIAATCHAIRSRPWTPLLATQHATSKDRPAKGRIWISRTQFAAPPEPDLRDALYRVIARLSRPEHKVTAAAETAVRDVPVEFLGVREGVGDDAMEADMPEWEKLRELEGEWRGDMTVLFVHGGGMYFSSPQDYRAVTTRLAKLTKARIVSTGYRLSPQNTFPAPVLDVLLAYVSLLHPPAGAPYKAVPADKIVFAGNSAGATLLFALTKLLIELSRLKGPLAPKIRFHGKNLDCIPLPAGIATVSGWCDPCDALPSWHTNGEYDFLGVLQPACMPGHPTDAIWPANPPREHPYCRAVTLDHDLVCAAAVEDWAGGPPVWFAVGCEERGLDGNKVTASQMAKSGVSVEWNEYEGMTHEFVIMTGKLPQAAHAFKQWAVACQGFVDGRCRTGAKRWLMPDVRPVDIGSPAGLSPLPHAVIREKMREYNATRPIWTGKLHETNMTKL